MAEIATYRCSNTQCLLTMMLSREFPIWHPATPTEIKSLSQTPAQSPYITGYHSEAFCQHCKKVVALSGDVTCARCGAADMRQEQSGHECPRCTRGRFLMTALSVY